MNTHTIRPTSPRANYRPQHLACMEARGVMPFDLLSPAAQSAAIANIRATDRHHHRESLAQTRSAIKANLDAAINNPHLIPALARRGKHVRRVERDDDYCRNYILQNLCEFSSDGQYRPLRTAAVNVCREIGLPPSSTAPEVREHFVALHTLQCRMGSPHQAKSPACDSSQHLARDVSCVD